MKINIYNDIYVHSPVVLEGNDMYDMSHNANRLQVSNESPLVLARLE